jgi:hypothetical protein
MIKSKGLCRTLLCYLLVVIPLLQTVRAQDSQIKNRPQRVKQPPATNSVENGIRISVAEAEAAREALVRLRVLRDSWNDPPPLYTEEDYRFSGDPTYMKDPENYPLYLKEAQDAVEHALTIIKAPPLRQEIKAAIAVFNDLTAIYSLFISKKYRFSRTVEVSDIYSFVKAYHIPYQTNSITKNEVYRVMVPERRVHLDRLAHWIPGHIPPDSNPSLSPSQSLAAADEKDWLTASKAGAFGWYLARYPQGRHAKEAALKVTERSKLEAELKSAVRETFEALIRGDKQVMEQLLAAYFPHRSQFIAAMAPHTEVVSFEIETIEVQPVPMMKDQYLVTTSILYKGYERVRRFENRLTFVKVDGRWRIISWESQ